MILTEERVTPREHDAPIVHFCAICREEIYIGEPFYQSELGAICIECDRAYLKMIRRIAVYEENGPFAKP